MYIWKTSLLAEDLRSNLVDETSFKNYYLASSLLTAICFYLTILQPNQNFPALATEALGTLTVTILGINAAFAANGGAGGVRFIERIISLAFPLLIKVFLAGMGVGLIAGILEVLGMTKPQLEWGTAVSAIAIQVVFYLRLVTHIRRANA
jgi:hypothetical protein